MQGRDGGWRAFALSAIGVIGGLCLAGLLLWTAADTARALTSGTGAVASATFEDAVMFTAAVLAWLVTSWLLLGALATALAPVPGDVGRFARRASLRIAPACIRRLTAAVLGVALVSAPAVAAAPSAAGTAGPAATSSAPGAPGVSGVARGPVASMGAGTGSLDRPVMPAAPLPAAAVPAAGAPTDPGPANALPVQPALSWTPDRPVSPPRPQSDPEAVRLVTGSPNAEQAVSDEIAVRAGDTLWDIVARHLGPAATAAEVATEWPRWHHANREVIGADPGLILPGQLLVPPT